MNQLTASTLGITLSAAFIYLLLRLFASNSTPTNRSRNISRHALWTSIIGLLASGVTGLANLWEVPATDRMGNDSPGILLIHALAPGLWLGIIYILGQYTWPRHLKPVRTASLQVRQVRNLVPKYLAGILLLCTLLSAAAITVAWNDPGAPSRTGSHEATAQGLSFDYDEQGNPLDATGRVIPDDQLDVNGEPIAELDDGRPHVEQITGTRPGTEVGPYLAGGLGMVLLAVATVITVIIRRPPLQTLGPQDNDTLRCIWINRLLRTAVIIIAGFGTMSLQYLAQGIGARQLWDAPTGADGYPYFADGEGITHWFLTGSSLWVLLVAVLMLFWAPPRLPATLTVAPRTVPATSPGFAKARDFLFLVQALAVLACFAAATIFGLGSGSSSSEETATWQTSTVNGQTVEELVHSTGTLGLTRLDEIRSAAFLLALLAGVYLLLQLLANYVITRRLGGAFIQASPRRELLPRWFMFLVGSAVAIACATIASYAVLAAKDQAMATAWMLGILGGVALLAVLLNRNTASRPALEGADAWEDFQIRVVIAHRGARVLGGVSLIITGILSGSGFLTPARYADYLPPEALAGPTGIQILCYTLGLGLCFLPAATALWWTGLRARSTVSSPA